MLHYDWTKNGGQVKDGQVNVRQVSYLEHFYLPNRATPYSLDKAKLLRASTVAAGIRTIHTAGPQYERLRRGFHAWMRGIQEFYGGDRLHQFVRAVEALVKPEIGRSTNLFVHRCQVFAGNSRVSTELLRELYVLRNLTEHLNSLDQVLANYPAADRETVALRRAFQAQHLASHVYGHLLCDPVKLARFATDNDIDAFWSMLWADQVGAWGPAIDLETEAAARFI